MSDDIRVLLVQARRPAAQHADAAPHPIRSKTRRASHGTMDIYAPLAERIGMYEFMKEMQTLAFQQLEPEAYESVNKRLLQLKEGGGDRIAKIGSGLKLLLSRHGIEAESRAARNIPIRSGRRWPSGTSASSSSPTSWHSGRSCRARRHAIRRWA
jgi:(p)ppGpp synthase/HD superfamily hydrolase